MKRDWIDYQRPWKAVRVGERFVVQDARGAPLVSTDFEIVAVDIAEGHVPISRWPLGQHGQTSVQDARMDEEERAAIMLLRRYVHRLPLQGAGSLDRSTQDFLAVYDAEHPERVAATTETPDPDPAF